MNKNNYLTADLYNSEQMQDAKSVASIYSVNKRSRVRKWFVAIVIFLAIILFLPWTQNIKTQGKVTTLRQENRAQEINATIAGRVAKWYVKEGDEVKAGDTILQLSEVKVEYLDPNLLKRTSQQIVSKQLSIEGYNNKAKTVGTQINALESAKMLKMQSIENKLKQQELKVKTDEADLVAIDNELATYQRQIDAAQVLLTNGAISLTEFEKRKVSYQNAIAKQNSTTNKLLQSRQEITNLRIEQNSVAQEYNDKIAKAEGDRFASLSNAASTDADVSKLQSTYTSYDARNKFYYLLAPQNGQVTNARKAGLGEMLKEGESIATIVPIHADYAVELYIEPMDLPLIEKGQKVRFVFDGFPAIVFSGWPQGSFGTFGGVVAAIETSVSDNGKFRILIKQDTTQGPWPTQLKLGGGASGIALLKDVFVGYELWRQVNGFPPEYYKPNTNAKKEKK
jgi:multidrug efflux pump subunit AcrA (membrane-fusion protein)